MQFGSKYPPSVGVCALRCRVVKPKTTPTSPYLADRREEPKCLFPRALPFLASIWFDANKNGHPRQILTPTLHMGYVVYEGFSDLTPKLPSLISPSSGPRSRSFMATPPDERTSTEDGFPAWDDGGEYARAAEAAGVDVGGMLEAGVDAKQLLEFVSNFRRQEGDMNVRSAAALKRRTVVHRKAERRRHNDGTYTIQRFFRPIHRREREQPRS